MNCANISKVVYITGKDFKGKKLNKKVPGMVMFGANYCGHCISFMPKYQELSGLLDKVFKFYYIECSDVKNQELCSKFKIRGFPSIFYVDKNGKLGEEYKGDRSIVSILDFLLRENK